METVEITDEQLKAFCGEVDKLIITHYGEGHNSEETDLDYAKRVHNFEPTTFERGKKYARIVKNVNQRSAFCFIDLTNGNIHKADSWKAPEKKHVRGNISNGAADVSAYGTKYLR